VTGQNGQTPNIELDGCVEDQIGIESRTHLDRVPSD
jgi:hypothetical protein